MADPLPPDDQDIDLERAVVMLLSSRTIAGAARKLGWSRPRLRRLMDSPEFKRLWQQARRRILAHSVGRMSAATTAAVATLVKNLRAPKAGDQIRAAIGLLDLVLRGIEVEDLKGEVDELRALMEQKK